MEIPKLSTFILNTARRMMWFACWVIRHILQLFFFIPIHKNRVVIYASGGLQYHCNPKYISEYLVEHNKDLEIIWGFIHPGEYMGIHGIKPVTICSPVWFYYAVTAAVIITNDSIIRAQPKREGQLIIDTWHGGGAYKQMGFDTKVVMNKQEHRVQREFVENIDLFLSSSAVFTEGTLRHSFGYRGEVLCCGMPRNDIFFDDGRVKAASDRVKKSLGISGYVALYAPTFRGKYWIGERFNPDFPDREVLSALRKRFGDNVSLLKRAHPGGVMDDTAEKDVLDVTAYPDMQELLCAADLLITDYSSSIWDYALLGRPCLLYVPDVDKYISERGLYTPVEEWPGLVCRSKSELLHAISAFNADECRQKAIKHLQELGSYETGTATMQVCQRILQHMGLDNA